MSNKTHSLLTLDKYFKKKGRVLSAQEYARELDAPIRIQLVKNLFGGWNRMEKLIMALSRRDQDAITDVQAVLDAHNKALYEAQKQWIEASENQDAKAQREAQAQAMAEKLALNAATPEGANANKIAIGGPLPSEQQDFDKMGATVNVDPKTLEQTVVDPEPEVHDINGLAEDPRTPAELAAAAKEELKTGSVETGKATDGGSQGEASVATASALATEDKADSKAPVKAPEKK